jgi:hypothetical protein
MEPAEITRVLGIEPRHSWKAGEPRAPLEGTNRETFWTQR